MSVETLGFGLAPFGTAPFGDPTVNTPVPGGPTAPSDGLGDLEEFQYELDGFLFGLGRPVEVEPPFTPGVSSWTTQMSDVPGGGRRFGVDTGEAKTWSFNLFTNELDSSGALASLEDGLRAWRAARIRRDSGAVSVLRYRLGNRIRRVYGRPGRWAPVLENRFMSGYAAVTATFETADDLHYDDIEETAELSLLAGAVGGFTFPAVFPLTTAATRTARQGRITITGDEPTWVTVRFSGPVTDPKLQIGEMVAGLRGPVLFDERITIDPRPWARTATREDGASVAGRLSRATVMARMLLEPGSYEAIFTGTDPTGRARATVSWRPARSSI